MDFEKITVQTMVNRPVKDVWKKWTTPEDIMEWNSASDDWYSPSAVNDLREGGEFHYQMAARNGSFGFDFAGIYDEVVPEARIAYTLGDGRKISVTFAEADGGVRITEVFDAETENSLELQRAGWQSILNHFKRHAEAS